MNKKISKLRTLMQKAGAGAKRKAKLLKSVGKGLTALDKTVAKAGKKGEIAGGCATAIQNDVDAIRTLLASV